MKTEREAREAEMEDRIKAIEARQRQQATQQSTQQKDSQLLGWIIAIGAAVLGVYLLGGC